MIPTYITCLGHGGAFAAADVGHTAYLVEHGAHRILVDCGGTVPHVLKEFGIDPASLTAILITHLHGDHVHGLEQILYHRHYVSKAPRIPLIMGEATTDDWLTCVRATRNDLESHVDLRGVETDAGVYILGEGVEVSARRVNHGGDVPNMACYCFLVELGSSSVFFSGDRTWDHDGCRFVLQDMKSADLAFHELELFSPPSGAHTNIADVIDYRPTMNIWWGHHGSSSRTVEAAPHLKLTRKGDMWRVVGRHVDYEPLDWTNPSNH
jgi:ribonuclease BN (tRNA processing enzyme)